MLAGVRVSPQWSQAASGVMALPQPRWNRVSGGWSPSASQRSDKKIKALVLHYGTHGGSGDLTSGPPISAGFQSDMNNFRRKYDIE